MDLLSLLITKIKLQVWLILTHLSKQMHDGLEKLNSATKQLSSCCVKISLFDVNYFVLELHITQIYYMIFTLPYAVLDKESPPSNTVVRPENDAYQLARSLYVSYFVLVAAFSS